MFDYSGQRQKFFYSTIFVSVVTVLSGVHAAFADNAVPQASGQEGGQGAKNAAPTQNPVATSKTKSASEIYWDAQAEREKAKHHQYYEGLAKNASETGRYQADGLRAQASKKGQAVYVPNDNAYMPMAARIPGYVPSTTNLPPRSPVYVSQDLEYAKMKEQMAQEKAEQLRKVDAEKAASIDQSLANMKSQMKESHVPGAAVARPDGSNLFVRYYGPTPSTKPYEVHPASARIVPHQYGQGQ